MKSRIAIELEIPEGADRQDVVDYVFDAVTTYKGCYPPDDPIFELDPNSVVVIDETKPVISLVPPSPNSLADLVQAIDRVAGALGTLTHHLRPPKEVSIGVEEKLAEARQYLLAIKERL